MTKLDQWSATELVAFAPPNKFTGRIDRFDNGSRIFPCSARANVRVRATSGMPIWVDLSSDFVLTLCLFGHCENGMDLPMAKHRLRKEENKSKTS